MMPSAAMAETSGSWTYSVTDDEVTITSYTGTECLNTIVVPSTLDGKTVVAIGENAFSGYANTITIPATVRSIGNDAFVNMGHLSVLRFLGDIPATLGNNCLPSYSETKIHVPKDAVDIYKNEWTNYSFYISADLAGTTFNRGEYSYLINDDYTATVLSYSGPEKNVGICSANYYDSTTGSSVMFSISAIADNAFAGNTTLQRVEIEEGIKKIGKNAFDCPNLKEVFLRLVNTPFEVADGAFPSDGDYKIYVNSGNVENYKTAWAAYANHISASPEGSTVTIGDFQYTYTNYDFSSASLKLEKYVGKSSSVTIPYRFTEDGRSFYVNEMSSDAFAGNTSIETVTFPSDLTYLSGSPTNLFQGCSNLSKVYINASTLNISSDFFSGCSSNLVIYVPNDYISYYSSLLSGYTIKANPFTVSITDDNFHYVLNDDMRSLSVDYYTNAGSDAVIPSSVKFTLDSEEVEYPVTGIKKKDCYSSSFSTLTIPASVTSIESGAFSEAFQLSVIKMLGETPATIGDDLFSSSRNVAIRVPIGTLDAYKEAWPQYASQMSENIAGTTFADGDLLYKVDDNYNLTLEQYIGSETDVLIPKAVEKGGASYSVTAIADYAFAGNTNLAFVCIPESVTSIGEQAFKGCTSLGKVSVGRENSPASLGNDAFADCASDLVIYVPRYWSDRYQSEWSAYSSHIQALDKTFSDDMFTYRLLADMRHVEVVSCSRSMTSSDDTLVIPEKVTDGDKSYPVIAIKSSVFREVNCNQLIIPASIETVEMCAFFYCDIKTVRFLGSSTKVDGNAFENSKLYTVFVPEDGYDFYAKNTPSISSCLAVVGDEMALNDEEGLTKITRNTYFEAGKLSYKRTFDDDAQYATLCLPFAFNPSDAGFEQAYTLMENVIHYVPTSAATGSDAAGQQEKFILMLKKENKTIPAGTPVFVKLGSAREMNVTSSSAVTISSDILNIDFGGQLTVVDWDGTSGLMEENTSLRMGYNATYESLDLESRTNPYTFNPDGTFGPQPSGTLNPFRMYLTVDSNIMSMANCKITIGLGGDDNTTGIQELVTVPAYQVSMPKAIYDLNGRIVSVTGSTQGLPKGVYVQNHKKIVVK